MGVGFAMRCQSKIANWVYALGLICALGVTGGCQRWNWRGKGFDDESKGWTEKMRLRPSADSAQFSGLDARAVEIERNLGVR